MDAIFNLLGAGTDLTTLLLITVEAKRLLFYNSYNENGNNNVDDDVTNSNRQDDIRNELNRRNRFKEVVQNGISLINEILANLANQETKPLTYMIEFERWQQMYNSLPTDESDYILLSSVFEFIVNIIEQMYNSMNALAIEVAERQKGTFTDNYVNELIAENVRRYEQVVQLRTENETQVEDAFQMRNATETQYNELFQLRNEIAELTTQNKQLNNALMLTAQQSNDKITLLLEENDRHVAELENVRSALANSQQENANLTTQFTQLLQEAAKYYNTLETATNQFNAEKHQFNQLLTVGRDEIDSLTMDNVSLREALRKTEKDVILSNIKPPQPSMTDDEFERRVEKLELSLPAYTNAKTYRVQELFATIDSDPDNAFWESLAAVLSLILDVRDPDTNTPEQSNFMLKIMLIVIEGGMRGYSDTAVSEAFSSVAQLIVSGSEVFPDPLIFYNRVANINLQTLVNMNLTSLYRRHNDVYPKLASNRLFGRKHPLPALNTYRANKNFAKTSIYVYDDNVIQTLDDTKMKSL